MPMRMFAAVEMGGKSKGREVNGTGVGDGVAGAGPGAAVLPGSAARVRSDNALNQTIASATRRMRELWESEEFNQTDAHASIFAFNNRGVSRRSKGRHDR